MQQESIKIKLFESTYIENICVIKLLFITVKVGSQTWYLRNCI